MASRLQSFQTAEGRTIFIEADPDISSSLAGQPGFASASATDQAAALARRFEDLSGYLSELGQKLLARYEALPEAARPAKVGIDFAIGIEGETGIPFLALAKGTASATLKVEWSKTAGATNGTGRS